MTVTTIADIFDLPERVQDYLVGRQQWSWTPRFRTIRESVE